MKLLSVYRYIQRIDLTIDAMNQIRWDVDDRIQSVFSKHVVLAGAGMIEYAVSSIIEEYCRKNSNPKVRTFVSRSVKRQSTFSREKIRDLLDKFDTEWWQEIEKQTSKDIKDSVDSLRNVRNQIAHGDHNGTAYHFALQYYEHAKTFVDIIDEVVNPSIGNRG